MTRLHVHIVPACDEHEGLHEGLHTVTQVLQVRVVTRIGEEIVPWNKIYLGLYPLSGTP